MKIAIIGAGFGGMAAAYDLRKSGHEVIIFEAADYVGGLASGFKEPYWDWSVEKFYHHWFQSDKSMLGLIRELGWEDKVLFPRPYTVCIDKGKWYPFDSIFKALLFPGLGFGLNKIRFGFVGLYLRLTNNWKDLEKYTTDEWLCQMGGPHSLRKDVGTAAHRKVWAVLQRRQHGLDVGAHQSAQHTAGHVRGRVSKFRKYVRRQAQATGSGNPAGGAGEVHQTGTDHKLQIETAKIESYDKVLVTTSPNLMAKLCPDLPGSYLKGLLELKSMGAVVMVLALKHQLSEQGYYWFNLPKDAGYPMLALVEHTNFVGPEHFGGDHIVYAGDYLEAGHEYFSMSDEQLLERFTPAFKKFNPAFEKDWVKKVWVFKTNYAQPVPLVNHSKNIPAIETPIDGLYFASMSQVYPWDRGTNFAVEIGRRAAKMMMA